MARISDAVTGRGSDWARQRVSEVVVSEAVIG